MPRNTDCVGLDVGGTFLKGARVSAEGRVLERLHEPIAGGSAESLLAQFASAIETLGGRGAARAVGLGLPGIVDRQSGCARNAPAVPALNGVPVRADLERRSGLPVLLENDANAAALAESWIGSARDIECLLFVTLGTGVGGGLVIGGRVWAGRSGYAGEVGHLQVDQDGVPCACGSRGCVETFAGSRGWRRQAEHLLKARPSQLAGRDLEPKTIVEVAQAGDAVALEVVQSAARALGVGLAAALDLLNIECVVIGGGVSAAGPFLLERIVEETRQRTFPQVFADCSFRLAVLGNDAGVLGAARAAMLSEEPLGAASA